MLNFEEKNIKEKQAYALHENMTFGVWEKDFEDRQSLVEKTFEEVFEHWHCDIQCELFYNDTELRTYGSETYDFYGYGTCVENIQEDIDGFINQYNVKKDDKLELRVYLKKNRTFYYRDSNGKMRVIPKNAYVNYKEAKAHHNVRLEDRFKDEHFGKYDLSGPDFTTEKELIFSTLKDGFVFNKESVDKILEDFKKEKSLIIA